ncbi:hypothetical protein QR685DRAFT_353891 [Neurospora intermedia]|uniref:Glycosyltransferase family 31 protein n=1 Tax=Neurospora intermedia TaxID=5142 RepID=A0ABR3D5K5_NEUIN
MTMKVLLFQRPTRGFSIIVTLVFIIVLWSIARLRHHGSLLPTTFDKWGGIGEWKGQGGGGGGGGRGRGGSNPPPPADQTTLKGAQRPYRPKLEPGQCPKDLEFLRRPELGLTDNILYSRRCIKPVYKADFDRNTITNVAGPLVTNTTALDLTSCSHDEPIPCEPLALEVPMPYPKDAQYPHLLFGVASKYQRMREAIPAFAHWLAGTGARLVGTIADAVPPEHQDDSTRNSFNLTLLEEEYRAAGIIATFVPPKVFKRLNLKDGKPDPRPVPVEHHHFLVIKELLSVIDSSQSSPPPQWLAILDDDTFFPSLSPLSQTLSRYDHARPAWLGALSDDFMAVQAWGFMAFGGAGSFLSLPLARQLAPHLEQCITTASVQTGDGILRDCIYSHTRTRLTLVEGLNQHDIKGDPAGFFESGTWPVLSLHHWKSWYHAPVAKMARVAKEVCGDCFLMRVRFGTGTSKDNKKRKEEESLLSLGYSITQYPGLANGLDEIDLSRVEGTWKEADRKEKWAFSYGPVRRRLQVNKEKKSWRLVDVDVGEEEDLLSLPSKPPSQSATNKKEVGGAKEGRAWISPRKGKKRFRQIYVHKAAGPAVGESMDEVIELVWEV